MKSKLLLLSMLTAGEAALSNTSAPLNIELPIKKVYLFSSGVGYFEHKDTIDGTVNLKLSFKEDVMNDVLKSLIVRDDGVSAPFISYPSKDTIKQMFEGIKVDIFGNPSIEQILVSLKGEEVEIYAPNSIKGKIIGTQGGNPSNLLSLLIGNKIQLIPMKDIISYSFTNPKIMADLNRALEIISNPKNGDMSNLNIYLPSNKKRDVTISYVIQSPVWKATYRIDLSMEKPFLQGWAIVDNADGADWKDVELSLVVGRPSSFIQPLYAPYYTNRPTLPLFIAGFAKAQTYSGGYANEDTKGIFSYAPSHAMEKMAVAELSEGAELDHDDNDIMNTNPLGEQFVFTAKNPVTLQRKQSAMIPLVQGFFEAQKVSIFSAQQMAYQATLNPSLGIELKNSLGVKLPAGPITVYDGGAYAGDALIEFFAPNDKRLISYGDDLSVEGIISSSTNSYTDVVKINKGILNILRKNVYSKEYTLKNNANERKNIILEHRFIANAKLVQPSKYMEKTANLYRFNFYVEAGKELKYMVKEEIPYSENVAIFDCGYSELTAYSINEEIPQNIKDAFKRAIVLMDNIKNKEELLYSAKKELSSKESEQDRIRQNMKTIGSATVQYDEYLKRLTRIDADIDEIYLNIKKIEGELSKAKKSYDDYIANLSI